MLRNRIQSALYILGFLILIPVIGLGLGLLGWPLHVRWLLMMGVFVGLLALVGREVTAREMDVTLPDGRTTRRYVPGRFDGILIDLRHKISLSRLQLVLWTVVVLSAWATFALHRAIPVVQGRLLASSVLPAEELATLLAGNNPPADADNARAAAMLEQLIGEPVAVPGSEAVATAASSRYDALDIRIPTEVLAALGISLASLAGASAIKTNRATTTEGRSVEIVEAKREKLRGQVARVETMASRSQALASQSQALESQSQALESQSQRLESRLENMGSPLEDAGADPQVAVARAATQAQWAETQTALAQSRAAEAQAQAELAELRARLQAAEGTAVKAAERAAHLEAAQDQAVGDLHANPSIQDARWSDMLRGDTIANFELPDLGKIQMFLFTAILVFTYAVLLWSTMTMPAMPQALQLSPWISLPGFSDSLALTLGLSNGGYLATKTTA